MLTLKVVLILTAVVLFILAAFGVSVLGAHLGWIGLAFLAASRLAA